MPIYTTDRHAVNRKISCGGKVQAGERQGWRMNITIGSSFHIVNTNTNTNKNSGSNKKTNSNKNKSGIYKSKPSVAYMASKDLARIAAAKTPAQVRWIMLQLRGECKKIKASGADAAQIRTACKRIGGVLKKAGIKIQDLEKEKALKELAKHQRNDGDIEAAEITEKELMEKRKKRKAKEYGQIMDNGDISAMMERKNQTAETYSYMTSVDITSAESVAAAETAVIDVTL